MPKFEFVYEGDGARLDIYLASVLEDVSRSRAGELCVDGSVLVNGNKKGKSFIKSILTEHKKNSADFRGVLFLCIISCFKKGYNTDFFRAFVIKGVGAFRNSASGCENIVNKKNFLSVNGRIRRKSTD